jgi:branched-chain amino acid transport system substrate-binding protein
MMKLHKSLKMAAVTVGAAVFSVSSLASAETFRIAHMDDMSGVFSDHGGKGASVAVQMAIEDSGGEVLGRKIELLTVDHQNKPDQASAHARRFLDSENVNAIVFGGASSAGLAAHGVARERGKISLISGGYAPQFSGEQCSPYGTHWAPTTGALASAVAKGIVQQGGKRWFFITADYVFGHSLESEAAQAVEAAGGEVIGRVRHPLGTADLSAQLLRAQASGADVIGLANAGNDLVSSIQQAKEFGIDLNKMAGLLVFINNVAAIGSSDAQGTRLATPFYWDANEQSREWGKRFIERHGRAPTMSQSMAYASTSHYLKAVKAVGTADADAVMKKMQELPIKSPVLENATLQGNGRVVMDMYLAEAKAPKEVKGEWDLYRVVKTIPGKDLFKPAAETGCALAK